jgi:hypothetical protein
MIWARREIRDAPNTIYGPIIYWTDDFGYDHSSEDPDWRTEFQRTVRDR